MLSEFADNADFDTDGSALEDETKFRICKPWKLAIDSIRNYFGEKIALYYLFISTYCGNLLGMAILGAIFQILYKVGSDDGLFHQFRTITFGIILVGWSTIFLENWKRSEALFAQEFGQIGFEQDQTVRPAFDGKYIRCITNDDMNDEYYPESKRMVKMAFSYSIAFIIIACCVTCVFLLFLLKEYFRKCNCVGGNSLIINTVPSVLNSIQILIFNGIYQAIAIKSNDKENHKYFNSYENSLIFKIFFFSFVNTFNSFFLIAFLSKFFPSLKFCEVKKKINNKTVSIDNCFEVLESRVSSLFIITFIKNIPQFITPLIKKKLKQKLKKKDEGDIITPFTQIDKAIEEQFELEAYQTNLEVDGTMTDYMEMVVQFAFLNLFALSFPAAYVIAFFNNITQIQVDKFKLFNFCRRPVPAGAANIGTWYFILEIISFFGIFTNAGLIAFTSGAFKKNNIMYFTIVLLIFLSVKYLAKMIIPDVPKEAMIIRKRHQNIIDRVVKGFNNKDSNKVFKYKPNIKIGGVIKHNEVDHVHDKNNIK